MTAKRKAIVVGLGGVLLALMASVTIPNVADEERGAVVAPPPGTVAPTFDTDQPAQEEEDSEELEAARARMAAIADGLTRGELQRVVYKHGAVFEVHAGKEGRYDGITAVFNPVAFDRRHFGGFFVDEVTGRCVGIVFRGKDGATIEPDDSRIDPEMLGAFLEVNVAATVSGEGDKVVLADDEQRTKVGRVIREDR